MRTKTSVTERPAAYLTLLMLQRAGKKELEELIQRYEDKRQLWKAPAWAEAQLASAARGSGGSPSMRRAAPVVQPR